MDGKWLYWHVYPTQEQAFDARANHPRASDLIVTAMDYTADARKQYAVTSLQSAFLHCMELVEPRYTNAYGAHQYELLMPHAALRLYCDAEFSVTLNPRLDGRACMDALCYYIGQAYGEIPNRPMATLDRALVHVETSHRSAIKASYHIKLDVRCGVVADMSAQRVFWARVMSLVEDDVAKAKDRACLLRIKAKRRRQGAPDEEIETWFWDGTVYTKHRLMRFLGACKFPVPGAAPSYLVPEGRTRSDIDFETWRASLVTVDMRTEPAPVVLALPGAWVSLVDRYWKTPVVSDTPVKGTVSRAARDAAIDRYIEQCYPVADLERMFSMGGRVQLAYRHLALANAHGAYRHAVAHASPADIVREMRAFNAAIVHVGEATGEGTVPLPDEPAVAELVYGHYTLRELCFDIDVTDYDAEGKIPWARSARWCACKGKGQVCSECWYFVEAAAVFLCDMLVRRMGIDERAILWVFSGAKGLHVWVNAPECLFMTCEERANLLERYLDIDMPSLMFPAGAGGPCDASLATLFERFLVPHFTEYAIEKRNLLSHERASLILEQWAAWLDDWAPEAAQRLQAIVKHDLPRAMTSLDVWRRVVERMPSRAFVYWIVAQYAWPRIDSKVTTRQRGTLKAPFSVHAKTRTVSVPIAWPGDGRVDVERLHALCLGNIAATVDTMKREPLFEEARARLNQWILYYNNTRT